MKTSIKRMRERAGITQVELAGMLGVNQSSVCQWENGQTLPKTSLLVPLAKALGCTIDDLLTPVGEREPQEAV